METNAIFIRTPEISWAPASSIYGESVMYDGKEIVFIKQLTNRLESGKVVAYLIKCDKSPVKSFHMAFVPILFLVTAVVWTIKQ